MAEVNWSVLSFKGKVEPGENRAEWRAQRLEFKATRVTNPGPNGEEYAWYQCTVNGGQEGRPIGAYELAKAVEELEKYCLTVLTVMAKAKDMI
ncbi:hypothetical protein SLE2022_018490 [Rubroshorea leprosula]